MFLKKNFNDCLDNLERCILVVLIVAAFLFSSSVVHLGIKPISFSAASTKASKSTIQPRVAICLTGGAREFELTGPSIGKRVLDVYERADIFLNAPLDRDSYKLLLLNGKRRFAIARISKQRPIKETRMYRELLSPGGSANGIQGLLQYFNLVEGCWNMITFYERHNRIKYDWIIRARLDSYWSAPIDPIDSFPKGAYTIPIGSNYFGLNDRFGVGDRETSRVALQRFSILPKIYNRTNLRFINSETAYKAQFDLNHGVRIESRMIPCCVVSHKCFNWPLNAFDLPVASMGGKGPLNGAYCRPCDAAASGSKARAMHDRLNVDWAWIGPPAAMDLQLCNSSSDWPRNWTQIFDAAAGPFAARKRRFMQSVSLEDCVSRLENFRKKWQFWDAPSPLHVCMEHFYS